MALRIYQVHLKIQPFPLPTTTHFSTSSTRSRTQIPCTNKKSISDADLASDLATEVGKLNTHQVQREEAMKKSKEMLFTDLCQYLDSDKGAVKKKWSKMDQEEKWVLLKDFVNDWGVNFHPLSARSAKEMIEEYLHEQKPSSSSADPASTSVLFPGLKRIFMGFSQDK